MTAAPIPEPAPFAPATAMDLGHELRYPLRLDRDGVVEWRSACACHWWWKLDPTEAEAAVQ